LSAALGGLRVEGLDLLASAVLVLDEYGIVRFANASAESLFHLSRRALQGQSAFALFRHADELKAAFDEACRQAFSDKRLHLLLERQGTGWVPLAGVVAALYRPDFPVLIELHEIEQQLKVDREERLLDQSQANRELVRNLAHEIKNPLGGIRGAAQLLEGELDSAELREYTQVIIKEADRLQVLVDRLLAPHRRPRVVGDVNIHEVCERVRSLVLAEHPKGLAIVRDYDISAPEFRGDREQLIQAVLNIVQNAAQALREGIEAGTAKVILRTRVARQVTLAKQRYRLALDLHIVDNGPGVPEEIRDRIFYPLVSGREGGSGLGLTLAQTFVQQHDGVIEVDSEPGRTDFRILIPLP
jgi:two-component system nitrogen regulation sensor histidine kinase GlnL